MKIKEKIDELNRSIYNKRKIHIKISRNLENIMIILNYK